MPIPTFIFSMVHFSTMMDDKRLVTWLDRIECKVSKKGKCIFRFWHLAKMESSQGNLFSRQIGNVVVNLVNEVKHVKIACLLFISFGMLDKVY